MMEDEKIIELFFARDEAAIRATEEKFGGYCMKIAGNIVGREDAEECVNEVLFKAWQAIPPAHPKRLYVFLGRMTRNICITKHRSTSAKKRGGGCLTAVDELEQIVSGHEDVEGMVDEHALVEQINVFLGGLTKKNRGIFIRRYWYADDIPEIAGRFSLSDGAVYVRLNRLRSNLREFLTERGFEI